jgi:hypothetical protein
MVLGAVKGRAQARAGSGLVELAIIDSAFPDASDWLHDSTRRDLAMGDISREGDEQFAGERYD